MISTLDLLRSRLLKLTLNTGGLRHLFYNRADRVFVLFLAALFFYLAASLFYPLWILLIGPIVWGVPHLIASLRYSTQNLPLAKNQKDSIQKIHLLLWTGLFIYRFLNDVIEYPMPLAQYPLLMESLALATASLFQIYFVRADLKQNIFSILFSAILISMIYLFPIPTALVILIGHNYVPLIYWYNSCSSQKDFKIFALASSLLILCSLAIYFGWFMAVYKWISPQGTIGFLGWDYSDIIQPYVTENFDYEFWFRIVSLYAFSQALHYFMWLKAIPENFQKQDHPPSFRTSFSILQSEFGSGSVGVLLVFCVIGISLWGLFEFQSARLFYFSLASYHGFMELSAIAFLKSKTKK